MFIKDDPLKFFDYLQNLKKDSFLIAENCFPIQRFHLQTIKRNINNQEIEFLTIKNIVIFEEKRNQGTFSKFVFPLLDNLNFNICFDDIVNDHLFKFLINNHYKPFVYTKNNQQIRAAYKIK